MDGDHVHRLDGCCRQNGLLGRHVENAVHRQKGIVDMLYGQVGHFGNVPRVAGMVEMDPVETDHVTDAGAFGVVRIVGGNGPHGGAPDGEAFVGTALKGLGIRDDNTGGFALDEAQDIVVAVLVRDQHRVGRIGVIAGLVRIDIDDLLLRGFDLDARMPDDGQRIENRTRFADGDLGICTAVRRREREHQDGEQAARYRFLHHWLLFCQKHLREMEELHCETGYNSVEQLENKRDHPGHRSDRKWENDHPLRPSQYD